VPEGWVARRWDPAVQERFRQLLLALGKEFDGKVEGINLRGDRGGIWRERKVVSKRLHPAAYRDAVITNMIALKRAFAKSVTMQYANFMPGEWLPGNDHPISAACITSQRIEGRRRRPRSPAVQARTNESLLSSQQGMCREDSYRNRGSRRQLSTRESEDWPAGEHFRIGRVCHGAAQGDYIFWCTQNPFIPKS